MIEAARQAPAMHELSIEDARKQVELMMAQYPPDRSAVDREIPGPEGRLKVRIYEPASEPVGIYLHFHGGGFVVVSPYYRLAPEHPYPAAWDDAEAAGVWLAENAASEFGAADLCVGGESAGGNLACSTLVRMQERHSYTGFKAANLVYEGYSAGWTPSMLAPSGDSTFSLEAIRWMVEQVFPGKDYGAGTDFEPELYQDLSGLPPALFTVGTLDALLDDTLFMYSRWIAAGNEADIQVCPGANHGFDIAPTKLAKTARDWMHTFLKGHVSQPATVQEAAQTSDCVSRKRVPQTGTESLSAGRPPAGGSA